MPWLIQSRQLVPHFHLLGMGAGVATFHTTLKKKRSRMTSPTRTLSCRMRRKWLSLLRMLSRANALPHPLQNRVWKQIPEMLHSSRRV
jgi:hypothetical protein